MHLLAEVRMDLIPRTSRLSRISRRDLEPALGIAIREGVAQDIGVKRELYPLLALDQSSRYEAEILASSE